MKLSKFNMEIDNSNGKIIYNSLSGGVLSLNKLYADIFSSMNLNKEDFSTEEEQVIKELKKGLMIVENNLDEIDLLRVMRRKHQFDNSNLSLTIAPTTKCNFKCPYCYEKGIHQFSMDKEIVNKTIEYIKNNSNGKKNVHICWYGGEPLLEMESIIEITNNIKEFMTENKINYSASMVTNGFLLNQKNTSKLQELAITSLQITIDGDKETHDSRRCLHDGSSTYNVILNNIKNIPENISVSIRVNIDTSNSNIIDEIINLYSNENLNSNVNIYIAPVDNINDTCNNNCLDIKTFSNLELELFKRLRKTNNQKFFIPSTSLGICGANSINSFIIGPNGELYKCWNHIGNSKYIVGSIFEKNKMNELSCSYILDDPTNDKYCYDCSLLPVCFGGCVDTRIRGNKNKCTAAKYNIEEKLSIISMMNN